MGDNPSQLGVDKAGYVWWFHDDGTASMARTNPDNSPIPRPVTFYVPVIDDLPMAEAMAAAAALGAALARFQNALDKLRAVDVAVNVDDRKGE